MHQGATWTPSNNRWLALLQGTRCATWNTLPLVQDCSWSCRRPRSRESLWFGTCASESFPRGVCSVWAFAAYMWCHCEKPQVSLTTPPTCPQWRQLFFLCFLFQVSLQTNGLRGRMIASVFTFVFLVSFTLSLYRYFTCVSHIQCNAWHRHSCLPPFWILETRWDLGAHTLTCSLTHSVTQNKWRTNRWVIQRIGFC